VQILFSAYHLLQKIGHEPARLAGSFVAATAQQWRLLINLLTTLEGRSLNVYPVRRMVNG